MWLQQVKQGRVVRSYPVLNIRQAETLVGLMNAVRSFALITLAQETVANPQAAGNQELENCVNRVLDGHDIYGLVATMIRHFDDCDFQAIDGYKMYHMHPDRIQFVEVTA